MGVPALFRWLSAKYPKIVVPVIEDDPLSSIANRELMEKPRLPHAPPPSVNLLDPNPNGIEYDNLYLDMNGIIHPCTHPEGCEPPQNEQEMMEAIFEYTDRIFSMIRPRKLLYLAIDGVAPRAKLNQQRARRFRAAQEYEEKRLRKEQEEAEAIEEETNTDSVPSEELPEAAHFDVNCITPGTPFMAAISQAMRFYIQERISTNPAWQNIRVILSDSNVPGEGEHKIVDFIRRQRLQGLYVLKQGEQELSKRKKFSTKASSQQKENEHDQPIVPPELLSCGMFPYNPNEQHVIYGLDADLIMLTLATHEPRFSVLRENVFAQEAEQWSKCHRCGQEGHQASHCTNPPKPLPKKREKRPFIFLRIDIFREYLQAELCDDRAMRSDVERVIDDWIFLCFFVGNDFLPHIPCLEINEGAIDILIDLYKRENTMGYICQGPHVDFVKVERILSRLADAEGEIFIRRHEKEEQRKANEARRKGEEDVFIEELLKKSSTEEGGGESKHRSIKFHEPGFKQRYYEIKFGTESTSELVTGVVNAYLEGLAWVMAYYYQGCQSWSWFFPYHYAPFPSDFVGIASVFRANFELGAPFRPFDQLMSVFPASSKGHIPEPFHRLMAQELSDFYPTEFPVDLNGKRHAWQGVVLLPFIDTARLLQAMEPLYAKLSPEELVRNMLGWDNVYVHDSHMDNPLGNIYGIAERDHQRDQHGCSVGMPYGTIQRISALAYHYKVPEHDKTTLEFLYDLFPGCTLPARLLDQSEWDDVRKGRAAKRFPCILFYRSRPKASITTASNGESTTPSTPNYPQSSPASNVPLSVPSVPMPSFRYPSEIQQHSIVPPPVSHLYSPYYYMQQEYFHQVQTTSTMNVFTQYQPPPIQPAYHQYAPSPNAYQHSRAHPYHGHQEPLRDSYRPNQQQQFNHINQPETHHQPPQFNTAASRAQQHPGMRFDSHDFEY